MHWTRMIAVGAVVCWLTLAVVPGRAAEALGPTPPADEPVDVSGGGGTPVDLTADEPVDVAGQGADGVALIPVAEFKSSSAAPLTPTAASTALLPAIARPPAPATYRLVPAAGEFRAAWLHWQDYATPQAIARTVQRARRARLNALLPLANYPDQAMWQSRTIPVNRAVTSGFDPLRELVRQAHAGGLQIHPYLVMLHGGLTKHPAFQPDWFAVDARGHRVNNWLNPAHPGVREFLAALVCELVECGVDGVHYDYIRHEYDTDYDYGELTRRKFQEECGFDPLALKAGATTGTGMRLLQTSYHATTGGSYLTQQQQFLRGAGYRPPLVAEQNLGLLGSSTILVAGNLYSGRTKSATVEHLLRFAARGGVVVILDGPEVTTESRRLAAAVGLGGKGYFNDRPVRLSVAPGPFGLTDGVAPVIATRARGNACPDLGDATVLATFDDGTPAVTFREHGDGCFVVFNFHIYQSEAAGDAEVQRLFATVVDKLAERYAIRNTTRLGTGEVRGGPALWDRWRLEQVSSLVRYCTAAARQVRPTIITSAAGGAQREDLTRVRRDGLGWLRRNDVQFLCPMAYTTDNGLFQRRLARELEPLDSASQRAFLFAGIGVYKSPSSAARWCEQIAIARRLGFKGVCLFAFEDLTDQVINALANGPFRQSAPVPWQQVPVL